MREFWRNLRGILVNLPLVMSDDLGVKNVSLNRIVIATLVVAMLKLIDTAAANPILIGALLPIIQVLATLIGAQLGINMIKRGIDTFKQVKKPDQAAGQEETKGEP